ncbi:MAG: xylulokinase [Planctomycetota bacterium]|nr:xylulokinase [Planctomycetota bacterium]MDG2083372.1 xylulokinase [Planctomycetota bacterium]
MKQKLYLGIDVGTQGVKGVVIDSEEHPCVISRASKSLDLISGLPAGAAEQHPDDWWNAVVEVVQKLISDPTVDSSEIAGIGISGQQHGSVFVDSDDQVIRPAKLWCDTSTSQEAAELTEKIGHSIPVGFTASKVAWLARNEPEHWQRTDGVLLPHDFINLRLTGERTMEAGDASGTGWFDVKNRCFDEVAVSAIDPTLASKLPRLLETGEAAGRVCSKAAQQLGIPEGVVVSPGGGDNMMSAIGSGATRSGIVVMSLGTSGTVFTRTDHPVIDPEGLIAPFCSSDGGWLPLLCVMNCTNVTEEIRKAYFPDDPDALQRLTDLAAEVEPGCGGLEFVPFIHGERVPDLPHATGTIIGIRPGGLQPGVIFRAALEGITANLCSGIARMKRLGVEVDALRLVGGGSKNLLWRQMIADTLQVPITLPEEPESAALGAALQAYKLQNGDSHDERT